MMVTWRGGDVLKTPIDRVDRGGDLPGKEVGDSHPCPGGTTLLPRLLVLRNLLELGFNTFLECREELIIRFPELRAKEPGDQAPQAPEPIIAHDGQAGLIPFGHERGHRPHQAAVGADHLLLNPLWRMKDVPSALDDPAAVPLPLVLAQHHVALTLEDPLCL